MQSSALPILQMSIAPGVLDLGWGHPDPALLPVMELRQAAAAALDRWGADALMYGYAGGPGPLIDWVTDWIARTEERAPGSGELLITGGVSQALDQVCTLLTAPGDVALVELPSYHLAVKTLRDHPLDLVGVPFDEEGLQVDALAMTIAAVRRTGCRPRLLYTIPTFHNPTGVSLSTARRTALVALAETEDLLIVEDDAYRALTYDAASPPSLWSLAPTGRVVRLGSFAKVVAPGLRLGWLTADAVTVERFTNGGLLDSGGGINHYSALVMAAFCAAGGYERQVTRLRAAYRLRRDALASALTEHLPDDCHWRIPAGGFFIWVRLPEHCNSTTLPPRAAAAGVGYAPGERFFLDGSGANMLRLAFGLYQADDLATAAQRLGQVLREE